MSQDCPIDHDAAERAVDRLPDPVRRSVYFGVGAVSVRWLHENRLFGKYLSDYRERGIISSRVRHASLVVLWGFIGVSAVLLVNRLWAVAILLFVALAVTVHLYSLPTEVRVSARD
jgi:hypothetical protein